jgi:hypothetical protein
MKADEEFYIGCWYSTEAVPLSKGKITKICSYCIGVYIFLNLINKK